MTLRLPFWCSGKYQTPALAIKPDLRGEVRWNKQQGKCPEGKPLPRVIFALSCPALLDNRISDLKLRTMPELSKSLVSSSSR
jgi:hypothetical protein